tara:strand:- start:627 stop:1151 length:525 start_codon:yes stop_codon:yes gene_type:complete
MSAIDKQPTKTDAPLPKPKQKRVDYTKETRPLANNQLCKQLCTWLALDCPTDSFDSELIRSMLGSYNKLVVKQQKKSDEALSDKQYNILYNIYDKYRVSDCFKFEELRFMCVDISQFETLEVHSVSNELCSQFYFQTADKSVYTIKEFIEKYHDLIKHPKYITKLPAVSDDDFV